jgi:hypothetical protein
MSPPSLSFLVVLSILPACQSRSKPPAPSDTSAATGIEVRVDRVEYRPGDQITLTIVNHDQVQYAFNPCTRSLEERSGGAWQTVQEPPRACTMEAWLLDPGMTQEANTELSASTTPGEYRVLIAFSQQTPGGSAVQGRSAAFQVR